MDKDTRNAIERATQRARKLLEEDFAAQLEGDFDVHRDGAVAAKAGGHLSARQAFQRERIVAAFEHKRAAGMSAPDAARDYLRDAAFTALNRFVALKMLEARDLVQECISKGEQSAGYREFCGMAPGLPLLPDGAGYRLYIESLFDELSTEVKVLFDRRDPSSVLWPKRATFEQFLEIVNAAELARVWGEDETIGWVYQFFNGQDERRNMREESQAPRNSRELAVRNQFFTPRYVVQFLTDNTLGRIWYEMRGTKTTLADTCEYMVRNPSEEFAPRAKKDPRDLRVLDPACGSGHFLLYAFDLLLAIYEEAYADPASPKSEATGKTLADDYASLDALRKAVPGLVLAQNLHGVDIDPRCAQIAQLALWMRTQKAYRESGIGRADRPPIQRSNIFLAEPLVADEQIAREFVVKLGDIELGRVFTALVEALSLAGDLGVLLRVEQVVTQHVKLGQAGYLFTPPEERIRAALDRFALEEASSTNTRRRLFADDAVHGVALLGIAEKKFDVILMNPPFGEPTKRSQSYLREQYPAERNEVIACFLTRTVELLASRGMYGALSSRTVFFNTFTESARARAFFGEAGLATLADLGWRVLDGAAVEAAAYCGEKGTERLTATAVRALRDTDAANAVLQRIQSMRAGKPSNEVFEPQLSHLKALPHTPVAYWMSATFTSALANTKTLSDAGVRALVGLSTADNFRHLRLTWEVPLGSAGPIGARWVPLAKGGEYNPLYDDLHLLLWWEAEGYALKNEEAATVRNAQFYGRSGATYPYRTASGFCVRLLPSGCAFSDGGHGLIPPEGTNDQDLIIRIAASCHGRVARAALEIFIGEGGSISAEGAARNYVPRAVEEMPVGDFAHLMDALTSKRWAAFMRWPFLMEETGREFSGLPVSLRDRGLRATALALARLEERWILELLRDIESEDARVCEKFGLSKSDIDFLDEEFGPYVSGHSASAPESEVLRLYGLGKDELTRQAMAAVGSRRYTAKKMFWVSRRIELVCRTLSAPPSYVVEVLRSAEAVNPDDLRELAERFLSFLFGRATGRWKLRFIEISVPEFTLVPISPAPPAFDSRQERVREVLVDDPGSVDDVHAAIVQAASEALGDEGPARIQEALDIVAAGTTDLRQWLARDFFGHHLQTYSKSRRKAPIYWQLATPSASYSVWLYVHAITKDTLFRVQNDYAAPKLAHEQRRLDSLTSELRDGATAAQRKTLAVQEAAVDELRGFLDEVKRVAPLWKPNLDDGVIINFAPLWRLVPQNKSWQKELKSTWDALCEETFDWAHLAMHLWPERVVPKCAKDRSLAIAHGLEDVFWVAKTDGKWTARETPTRSADELVRERTSPAVKSALKSLLEAPAAAGKSGGRRSGGGRKSSAAATGGDA